MTQVTLVGILEYQNPCHPRYPCLKNNQKESSDRASGQPPLATQKLKNLKNLNKIGMV